MVSTAWKEASMHSASRVTRGRRLRAGAPLVSLLLVVSCTIRDQQQLSGPTAVSQILLTPSHTTLAAGASRQFRVVGRTAAGDSVDAVVDFTATGGTMTGDGMYTAGPAAGDYQVIASLRGGGAVADTSVVTITVAGPPVLAQIVLVPSSASVTVGGSRQFAAYGRLSTGDSIAVGVIYTATGGTISSTGLYTADQTPGTYRVIASDSTGAHADTATVGVSGMTTGGSVLVGAGDIAGCGSSGDEQTAALLDGIEGTVFTTGDNAYPDGSATDFANCYDPSWGRHKSRTRPAPGNHDYHTSSGAGYYAYFGTNAGDPGVGYYSYDVGEWHIISLNSNVSMSAGSAQEQWLRADLAASTKACTLAYWHHPRFSSGSKHGSSASSQPLWQALYDAGADIVLAGHEHNYERFAPQTPTGTADPSRGIREFVVGTGGESHYDDGSTRLSNSEVFNGTTYGVLKLTLGPGTYSWEFVPVAGQSFTDNGSGTCH
jgi:hypothetical protein